VLAGSRSTDLDVGERGAEELAEDGAEGRAEADGRETAAAVLRCGVLGDHSLEQRHDARHGEGHEPAEQQQAGHRGGPAGHAADEDGGEA
jgi:hypothetical protein